MPRDSKVGQSVYEAVEKLIADNPGMSQQAAFDALHEQDNSRSKASIAANYYRMKRINGGGSPRRKSRRSRQPRVALAPTANGQVTPIMDFDKAEREIVLASKHAVEAIRDARKRVEQVQRLLRV